jgi:hypothetical protein
MFIKHKYVITLCTLTGDTSIASGGVDYVSSYVVQDVYIHNPEDIKELGACNRRVLLLYGDGGAVTAIWAVLVSICNLEFKHYMTFYSYDESEGDYCLKYDVLHILSLFVTNTVKMAPWCWNIVVGM